MRINRNSGWALFLIGCGALILLSKIGYGFGHLMHYLVPLAMIGLGYVGIKNGRNIIGWGLLILGAVALIGSISGLFGFLVAAGLIVYGFTLLKKSPETY